MPKLLTDNFQKQLNKHKHPWYCMEIHNSDHSEILEKYLDEEWADKNIKTFVYDAGSKIYAGSRSDINKVSKLLKNTVIFEKLQQDKKESRVIQDYYSNPKKNPYYNTI